MTSLLALIGPVLGVGNLAHAGVGMAKPVHVLKPAATVRRVLNMTAIAAVEAQIRAPRAWTRIDRRGPTASRTKKWLGG